MEIIRDATLFAPALLGTEPAASTR